jgi:hypothetical protein
MANNQLLASDNFNSGSLASGWSPTFGFTKGQVVVGSPNVVEPSTPNVTNGQYWSGLTWPSNQISEVTINALSASGDQKDFLSLIVRQSASAATLYRTDIVHTTASGFVATIYKFIAGVSTQLIQVSGFSVASGDVFSFSAIGSSIQLYQNGHRLAYIGNADITSGSPGFQQVSVNTVANNQVSAWRGYSAVQQDGIWNKQGVVLAPLAGDLTGLAIGIQCHSPVLFETGAQILSGAVFKMWVDNFSNVYYCESLDGINWTRRVSPVLAGFGNSCVHKVGSTYYMYCETSANNGIGPIEVFTSSDGISWTLQNATVLSRGAGGTWDSFNLDPFFGLIVDNGTWYGLYLGSNQDVSTGPFSTGLATSSDGINWTKYAGNPVLAGGNAVGLVKSGSLFYTWLQTTQVGQGNPLASFFDPVESVRYQSTDLINWANPTHSVHHSGFCESVNANTGYCTGAGGNILNVAGKAYNYINVGSGDSVTPIIGQIALAVGPASVESILLFPEDATKQVASDSFTNGPGSLSGNWATVNGALAFQIVSGPFAEPVSVGGTGAAAVYTGQAFNSDQYSEVTLHSTAASSNATPIVRASTSTLSWYGASIGPTGSSNTTFQLFKTLAGVTTNFPATVQIKPQAGDVFRLAVTTPSDGFPVLSLFQNGFLILQIQDYANSLTTGSPGMYSLASASVTDSQISSWAGGNMNILPSYLVPFLPNTALNSVSSPLFQLNKL